MKLLDLLKSKKPKQQTYEDRILSLVRLGCKLETIDKIRATFLSSNDLDCAIIFAIFNQDIVNDFDKLKLLVSSAYKNALSDKGGNGRNVQWHALQIVEAFKKVKSFGYKDEEIKGLF